MDKTLRKARAVAAASVAVAATLMSSHGVRADHDGDDDARVQHVLLVSVDGMHQRDLERYVNAHPQSTFARIAGEGVQYTHASASKPSDSFPGLLAFMTGGSPRSHGVFYDDAYDRTLFAPGSHCTGPIGTETQYAENIDYDLNALDGGGPPGSNHIDPTQLPLRLVNGVCTPVYPHDFVKVNTIMEVLHDAGRRTAWSDKHPAYEILNGPSGHGLDELFAPEINSTTVPGHLGAAWTDDPSFTRVYDGFKVAAVLNQIRGFDHSGTVKVGVPALFGMNFQSVSVAQKVTADGYLDAAGTPSPELATSLDAVDAALGAMLATLSSEHLLDRTLVVVGAKHGQSPIDVTRLHMIFSSAHPNPKATLDVTDPADLLAAHGINVALETADDVSLLWLADQSQTQTALSVLEADQNDANTTRIQTIDAGPTLARRFGDPGNGRTPDIIIQPIPGTIYSGSAKKIAEHGGFAADDTHVALVAWNPRLRAARVSATVTNAQVAPTILKVLGLNPRRLDAVRREGTSVLPGLAWRDDR